MDRSSLRDHTILITGASRGIGEAIAIRVASDGANVALLAKSERPHPKLPGTLGSAAEKVRSAGGNPLICRCDVRSLDDIERAVERTLGEFGRIDAVINNASAIFLAGTLDTPIKRFDLMHEVNARGTFAVTRACLPHLKKSKHPHVLNLAPPLNMDPGWFGPHVAYTMSKYGMSMCVLGMAEELRESGIAVNALWPRTTIATAAVRNILGGEALMRRSRKPRIVADAAHWILLQNPLLCTGNFFLDEDVLRSAGVTDFSQYSVDPSAELQDDLFL
ncbi:MAG: NAD(P)-dependent oxidoreductase [Candidatus Krumholzibacteriota bacterium]|nr:NAD(P)-dependent oxidoreductase [Candidatus Krumholzibacteriota bacterium]